MCVASRGISPGEFLNFRLLRSLLIKWTSVMLIALYRDECHTDRFLIQSHRFLIQSQRESVDYVLLWL